MPDDLPDSFCKDLSSERMQPRDIMKQTGRATDQKIVDHRSGFDDSEPFSSRDLSSGRMQLRGIAKQTEERFGNTPTYKRLAATLERIEEARATAVAAR